MKKLFLLALIILSCVTLIQCNNSKGTNQYSDNLEDAEISQEDLIARGSYLVHTIGCDHCHTPKKMTENGPVPDLSRWLMGYPEDQPLPEIVSDAVGPGKWILLNGDLTAAVGPWGVSFAANLTPDATGLGEWTFEQFQTAMTKGKFKGLEAGRPLLPPMPWQSYIKMDPTDLKAIYEYLKSIEPIENRVPDHIPPPQGDI